MMDAHAVEHSWLMSDRLRHETLHEGATAYLRVREEARRIWKDLGAEASTAVPSLFLGIAAKPGIALPGSMLFAGFDLLPDAALRVFRERYLQRGGKLVSAGNDAASNHGRLLSFADFEEEVFAAAAWSRELLERGEQGIAVVLPSLDRHRGIVERVFSDVLSPGTVLHEHDADGGLFELSLGERCGQEPLIAAALDAVELLRHRVPVDALSALLLGSFFGDAARFATLRARVDLRIRAAGVRDLSIPALRSLLRDQEGGDDLLFALQQLEPLDDRVPATEWTARIDEHLARLGWPGTRAPGSREYQARRRWESLLDEFSSFAAVLPPMSVTEMISRLRRMAHERIFQPETRHAPVQVLGMMETAGLRFSHCRILGMNEEYWPPPARPQALLPIAMQRRAGVTEAVPERYLRQMRTVTKRSETLAPSVMFSCSRQEGDRDLLPTPLLRHLPVEERSIIRSSYSRMLQQAGSEALEPRPEEVVSALPATETVRGGVRVLTLQAACHFRAFAELRLHAREPEQVEEGVRPLDRGSMLHAVLEHFWLRLSDQRALLALDAAGREAEVDRAIAEATRKQSNLRSAAYPAHLQEAETASLKRIVGEWLELEAARPPFTVLSTEQQRVAEFGQLAMRLRIDRIDRLQDGSLLLIDYKTSGKSPAAWMGGRPEEPQLPMYAVSDEEDVSSLAYAVLRRGESGMSGLSSEDRGIAGLQPAELWLERREDGPHTWAALLEEWKDTLRELAEGYRRGSVLVNPRDGAQSCRYCALHALCRIHELGYENTDD